MTQGFDFTSLSCWKLSRVAAVVEFFVTICDLAVASSVTHQEFDGDLVSCVESRRLLE